MGSVPEIFAIAGEPSGDQHAAMLGEALQQQGDVLLTGIGQHGMRRAGFDLLFDSAGWSAIGVVESLKRVPRLVVRKHQLLHHLQKTRPDLLVLVDFGAFNVRIARSIRNQMDLPVLYYFPPRSWSRDARYDRLSGLVDRVATPFQWSEALLRDVGIEAEWVGHPVVDRIAVPESATRLRLRRELAVGEDSAVVGLLPGSRPTEIRCNCPQMFGAGRIIASEVGSVTFLLSRAPAINERTLRTHLARHGIEDRTTILEGVSDIVRAADLVIASSGTATLETAAAACPMVIVYRGTALMALEKWLRRFNIDFVGMPNIIAGREVVPELIDRDAEAQSIARAALDILTDDGEMQAMRDRLLSVRQMLGVPGVSDRVAAMAFDMIGPGSQNDDSLGMDGSAPAGTSVSEEQER